MTDEEKKGWEELVNRHRRWPTIGDGPAILWVAAELDRLRGIEANERGLLDIIKGDEKELARLRLIEARAGEVVKVTVATPPA